MSVSILLLSNLQRLVFLLNSRFFLFSDNSIRLRKYCHSFSRSYRVNLPSSFSIVFLIALIYSIYPPVSVYGTIVYKLLFPESFLIPKKKSISSNIIKTFSQFKIFPLNYTFVIFLRDRILYKYVKHILAYLMDLRRQ